MGTPKRPVKLSPTYLHFNNLIWQIPSWGTAIAAGVIVAAAKVDDGIAPWVLPLCWIRAIILLFGGFPLLALTIALYRYRGYQAASAPYPLPKPPFGEHPAANKYLQGAMSLTTGSILGLGFAEGTGWPCVLLLGILLGVVFWILAERKHKRVEDKLEEANHSSTSSRAGEPPSSTP